MIGTSRRCYSSIKYWNGVLANNSSNNFGHILGLDQPKRNCSGDPKKPDPASCAKNTPQTQGREVEAWPKSDPPPQAWRCECPQDPQPPNYDPYRIRVPEVAVPPLPPNNAKWTGMLLTHDPHGQDQQGYGYGQQQQPTEQPQAQAQEEEKDEGLIGVLKSWFGMGKKNPKGPQESQMKGAHLTWSTVKCSGKGKDIFNIRRLITEAMEFVKDKIQNELPNEDRALFNNPEINFGNASAGIRDLFHNSPIVHPDYWKDKPTRRINKTVEDVLPRLGYHGRTKYKYAFHEPWKPLDRLALLAQAEEEESKQSQEAAAVEQSEKQIS